MSAASLPDCDVRVCELAGDGVLITVAGELDLATRNRLDAAINAAVDLAAARTAGDVVLDLIGLTFCDATGIDAMVAARDRLAHVGRRLVLVNASGQFRRLVALAQAGFLLDTPVLTVTRPAGRRPKKERLG